MTEGDNDVNQNMVDKADAIKNKVRNHSVRVSTNVTDFPTNRPKKYVPQRFGGSTNI